MQTNLKRCMAFMMMFLICGPAFPQAMLDRGQLDQLMAPIALYPDALLSQLLMASTYPDDVVLASNWSAKNSKLSGDEAVTAVQNENWDPSVQSLVAFPSVLDLMGRQPAWVTSVGDAFLAQPADVMDAVQRLRKSAQQAGYLNSTEQQNIVVDASAVATVVRIEPANPQVVYVPTYNPTIVYGAWPYNAYPPAYYPPPPGSAFANALVSGIGFGLGVAAVNSLWGGFDWGHNNVDINVNRYNNVNVNRRLDVRQNNVQWNHDPARRGNTPYKDVGSQKRYDSRRQAAIKSPTRGGGGNASKVISPSTRDASRDRAAQTLQQRQRAGSQGRQDATASGRSASGVSANERSRPRSSNSSLDATPDRTSRSTATHHVSTDRSTALDRSRANNRDNALRGASDEARAHQQPRRNDFKPPAAPVRPSNTGRRGSGTGVGSGGRSHGHDGGRR